MGIASSGRPVFPGMMLDPALLDFGAREDLFLAVDQELFVRAGVHSLFTEAGLPTPTAEPAKRSCRLAIAAIARSPSDNAASP